MSHYSIKDLEQLSGIKAHTLRIWEQRYNFIKPKRTETNIRFYDDNDLKLILNVSFLNKKGFKISKIASMNEQAIAEQVGKLSETASGYDDHIRSLVVAMLAFDEVRFEKTVNSVILKLGFEKAMMEIIYPFLKHVGILWQTSTVCPSHEHFITNLVRQKLIVAIDGLYIPETKKVKKFMLFLPEGELHELSLLFACFLIKARGFSLIYLGQSLPLEDLFEAFKVYTPDYLFTIITSAPDFENIENYLLSITEKFKVPLLVSGIPVIGKNIEVPSKVILLNRPEDLILYLQSV